MQKKQILMLMGAATLPTLVFAATPGGPATLPCPTLSLTTLPQAVCSSKAKPLGISGPKEQSRMLYNTEVSEQCDKTAGIDFKKGVQAFFKGKKEYNAVSSNIMTRAKGVCRYKFPKWVEDIWPQRMAQYPLGFTIVADITDAVISNVLPNDLCPAIGPKEYNEFITKSALVDKKTNGIEITWEPQTKADFPSSINLANAKTQDKAQGFLGTIANYQQACTYVYHPSGKETKVNTILEVIYNPFR